MINITSPPRPRHNVASQLNSNRSFNSHRSLSAGVSDWDLVTLGPGAVLQEDATVSAAQLEPGGIIALQRVVIDALVETGAHIPAGVHISQAVPPLTCDAPSKETSMQCEEDDSCGFHERRPLLPWLLAMCARGVGTALCDAALLALVFEVYLCLGLPTSGSIYSIVAELLMIAPLWKVLLLIGTTIVTGTLRPLAFAAWLVGVRRVFIRPVADGDCASHGVGSIFLELALRSNEVLLTDRMCSLINRPWVARAFGMQVATHSHLPLPKLDRPELVSIGEDSYSGGNNTLCTRQVSASGATYRQIRIGCDSFLTNGTVLMPGTSFGPRAVLGNRSLGVAGEDYSNAVFAGQKGEHVLSDISSRRQHPAHNRASSMRLWKVDPLKISSNHSCQAQNEGDSTAVLLLALLCMILLQGIDILILLAILLPRRLLGPHVAYTAVPFLFGLVCRPWLRLLWYLGATWLCKRFFVGSFCEEKSAKLDSRAALARRTFIHLLSLLDSTAETLKGSTIYNAIQRVLGAKVAPGVCWLGRQHVKSFLGPRCCELAR